MFAMTAEDVRLGGPSLYMMLTVIECNGDENLQRASEIRLRITGLVL
jgi:hypothetical protein